MSDKTKHLYAIELNSEQLLEIVDLYTKLKEDGVIPSNLNLGSFMKDAFYRGFYEYKKDILKAE